MRQTAALLALLALLSGVARAEGPGVKPSFTWPLPEGWKAETIPFPLDFAPDLRHTGVEELRFSPGFGDPAAPDNWNLASRLGSLSEEQVAVTLIDHTDRFRFIVASGVEWSSKAVSP